jgi:flagellar basal-body rod protein FlgF
MDNSSYTILTRQTGLARELQVVANNIANLATTGFRSEGVIFSEYIQGVTHGESLSMGMGNVHNTNFAQGVLTQTGGSLDFGIEGDGYFLVETPRGERLTRAGAFAANAQGELVTYDGFRVLDAGGAPIFVPSDAGPLSVSSDGTLSVNGAPIAQLGVVRPNAPLDLVREDGVMFRADAGFEQAQDARVAQGFTEGSNVNSVGQLARMIEVQRAYEMGQSFLESEDERVRTALKTLSQ